MVLLIFVGENLWAKVAQKLFLNFGENRAKIRRNTKKLPAPKPLMKKHLRPRCSVSERTER